MTEAQDTPVLLYQKDFTGLGGDQLYIFQEGELKSTTAIALFEITQPIVTHDYWLIAPFIFTETNKLPKNIIDICEVNQLLTGKKKNEVDKKINEINQLIKPFFDDNNCLKKYHEIFYRRIGFDLETYQIFAKKLAQLWEIKFIELDKKLESIRFFETELPVFNILSEVVCKGIRTNREELSNYKREIDKIYLRKLKEFGVKHSLLFELPCEKQVEELLEKQGYDVSELGIDYILEYLPIQSDFGKDYIDLKKIRLSKSILSQIPSRNERIFPILESQNSSTSRIYYKNPTLQNLAKQYRNIIVADTDKELVYVDYDQFEVGIMAALSGDLELINVYNNDDVYAELSTRIFGEVTRRSFAKGLFLAYTYGMNLEKIIRAITTAGGNEDAARNFYGKFSTFEEWKLKVETEYLNTGQVRTICGNHLYRSALNETLSTKEKRSCVNHIVQGTGSYIFKQVIIKISAIQGIEILVPMHDALLLQTATGFNHSQIVEVFKTTMTELLESKITAKASISNFFG